MPNLEDTIMRCLAEIGVKVNECRLGIYNCSSISMVHEAGVYVFFNGSEVYYVGKADGIARRLTKEH